MSETNFVDYGNMNALMTAIKSAIDNGGGGGSVDGYVEIPGATMADAKPGDLVTLQTGNVPFTPVRVTITNNAYPSLSTLSGTFNYSISPSCLLMVSEDTYNKYLEPLPASGYNGYKLYYVKSSGKYVMNVSRRVTVTDSSSSSVILRIDPSGFNPDVAVTNFKLYRVKS